MPGNKKLGKTGYMEKHKQKAAADAEERPRSTTPPQKPGNKRQKPENADDAEDRARSVTPPPPHLPPAPVDEPALEVQEEGDVAAAGDAGEGGEEAGDRDDTPHPAPTVGKGKKGKKGKAADQQLPGEKRPRKNFTLTPEQEDTVVNFCPIYIPVGVYVIHLLIVRKRDANQTQHKRLIRDKSVYIRIYLQ